MLNILPGTLHSKKIILGIVLWLVSMTYFVMMSWLAQESIGQNIATVGVWRTFEAHKDLDHQWRLIDPRPQALWDEIKRRYAPHLSTAPPLADSDNVDTSRGAWRAALLSQNVFLTEATGWGEEHDISLVWIQDQRKVLVYQPDVAVSTFNQGALPNTPTKPVLFRADPSQLLPSSTQSQPSSATDKDEIVITDNNNSNANPSAKLDPKDKNTSAQKFTIQQNQSDLSVSEMETYYRPILIIASYADKKVWFDPNQGVIIGKPKIEWQDAPALRLPRFTNRRW